MDVGDYFDGGEGMVEGDDGVEEHEETLGDFENILHGPSRPRLKVADAVISDITYSSSSQGW